MLPPPPFAARSTRRRSYAAPRPIVNYSYYAPPAPVYAPPAVSYYAGPVYAPPTVAYSVPVVPAPVVGGSYVTRTYTGYGIFRPRGTYTETYYQPWVR